MARGKIVSLPEDTGLELINRVLTICHKQEQDMASIGRDPFVSAVTAEYGERLVREHVSSLARLGFLKKENVTHALYLTTKRGCKLIGKRE